MSILTYLERCIADRNENQERFILNTESIKKGICQNAFMAREKYTKDDLEDYHIDFMKELIDSFNKVDLIKKESKMSKAKTSEFDLEQFIISSLLEHGWCYEKPVRATDEILLETSLINALCRLNPQLDLSKANEIYKELKSKNHLSLLDSNENFHYKLVNGVNISTTKDGESRADIINLIDFDNVSNNEFIVTNQLSITETKETKIPDVVLYINGIPLVLMELKSPSDENATINSAYNQINTYKQAIPSIFIYNAFCVISDGYFARVGSISADFSRFMAWKSSDGINYAPNKSLEIKTLIDGMLNPKTLLDIICNFIVFEKEQIKDINNILSIKTTKKIAA